MRWGTPIFGVSNFDIRVDDVFCAIKARSWCDGRWAMSRWWEKASRVRRGMDTSLLDPSGFLDSGILRHQMIRPRRGGATSFVTHKLRNLEYVSISGFQCLPSDDTSTGRSYESLQ